MFGGLLNYVDYFLERVLAASLFSPIYIAVSMISFACTCVSAAKLNTHTHTMNSFVSLLLLVLCVYVCVFLRLSRFNRAIVVSNPFLLEM